MSTYTIPADVELPSEVGAVVHIAVPAEPVVLAGDLMFVRDATSDDNGLREVDSPPPPPVLADLVGKQCETCDGDGYIDFETDGYQGPCSACAGSGFELVDLVRECDEGEPHGWSCPTDYGTGREWDGHTSCKGMGLVSLGRWKVKELLPVVTWDQYRNDIGLRGPLVVIDGPSGTFHYRDTSHIDYITVHGTPEPGGYVAKLEPVVAP